MILTTRNILATTVLALFSLASTGAATSSSTEKPVVVKVKKKVQEARTLDGKKPRACDFRISLS